MPGSVTSSRPATARRRENPRFWRELLPPLLRAHHRARADGARPRRRHLSPAVGDGDPARADPGGVDSQLEWYDDGHAFGPAFLAAMRRTVRFFDRQLG